MTLPFRILSVQTGTVCLAFALSLAWMALSQTPQQAVAAAGSMLTGGLCIVAPSALYAWLAAAEHRPNRLLLLAGFKVVLTLLLLFGAAASGRLLFGWLLTGIGVAYAAHLLAALWVTRDEHAL